MNSLEFLTEDQLYEMSNYSPKSTGLPNGIDLWVRTETTTYGHSIYRVKISKDRKDAGIYTVGQEPVFVKNINQSISKSEDRIIKTFIQEYSSLIIGHIDGKIDSGEFASELQKLQGAKNE